MPGKTKITAKRPQFGNNVPFSIKKTRHKWKINLQRKRFYVPELGKYVQMQITVDEMRTIDKIGVQAFLKRLNVKIENLIVD
jgi:large subunit ribosomal protein L28